MFVSLINCYSMLGITQRVVACIMLLYIHSLVLPVKIILVTYDECFDISLVESILQDSRSC